MAEISPGAERDILVAEWDAAARPNAAGNHNGGGFALDNWQRIRAVLSDAGTPAGAVPATPRDVQADISEVTEVLSTVNNLGTWMAGGMLASISEPVFVTIQHVTAKGIAARMVDLAADQDPAVVAFAQQFAAELAGAYPTSSKRIRS